MPVHRRLRNKLQSPSPQKNQSAPNRSSKWTWIATGAIKTTTKTTQTWRTHTSESCGPKNLLLLLRRTLKTKTLKMQAMIPPVTTPTQKIPTTTLPRQCTNPSPNACAPNPLKRQKSSRRTRRPCSATRALFSSAGCLRRSRRKGCVFLFLAPLCYKPLIYST